jgi:glycogen synthase
MADTRGRVVMLVDNGVHGDSRVQKTARSMSDAGWDVTLLGMKTAASPADSWRIGGAEVRLLPVKYTLITPPGQVRRSWRRPFAYPPGPQRTYQAQLAKVRRIDLEMRTAALRDLTGFARTTARGRLAAATLVAKVRGRWTRFRTGEANRLKAAQAKPRSPLNAVPIAFWRGILGPRSWRRLDPGLWDYELAFAEAIDELKPDLIHANDFRMLGVGARAVQRARARGRSVKLVWDAHESVSGIMPSAANPRWLPAQIQYVREFAPMADAVVTVSPTLAEMLEKEHNLPARPLVVLNTPPAPGEDAADVPDIRALCGIDATTPLMVYCGNVNVRRGLDTMVDALPKLPGMHVAFVTLNPNGKNAASEELLARAVKLGVGDRVHLLPYVPHWQVAPFLAPADLGVIPIHHQPNHEIALITKFFEFSHARLPIVVSDVKTMSETVLRTGQGEVFTAKDADGFVAAVRAVLADPKRYRAAYDKDGLLDGWTWEAQVDVLDGVYRRLVAGR